MTEIIVSRQSSPLNNTKINKLICIKIFTIWMLHVKVIFLSNSLPCTYYGMHIIIIIRQISIQLQYSVYLIITIAIQDQWVLIGSLWYAIYKLYCTNLICIFLDSLDIDGCLSRSDVNTTHFEFSSTTNNYFLEDIGCWCIHIPNCAYIYILIIYTYYIMTWNSWMTKFWIINALRCPNYLQGSVWLIVRGCNLDCYNAGWRV